MGNIQYQSVPSCCKWQKLSSNSKSDPGNMVASKGIVVNISKPPHKNKGSREQNKKPIENLYHNTRWSVICTNTKDSKWGKITWPKAYIVPTSMWKRAEGSQRESEKENQKLPGLTVKRADQFRSFFPTQYWSSAGDWVRTEGSEQSSSWIHCWNWPLRNFLQNRASPWGETCWNRIKTSQLG